MIHIRFLGAAFAASLAAAAAAGQTPPAMPAFSPAVTPTLTPPPAKPAKPEKPFVAAPFTAHAVVQRDRPMVVWGWSKPKTGVAVTFDGKVAKARVDKRGRWEATLPAHPGGGPYTLFATGSDGRDVQLADIMVGDVWLCSGQSNMEYPLSRVTGGPQAVESAADADLRLFFVPVAAPDQPAEEFGSATSWQLTSPASAKDFSAACFFMGRNLAKSAKVTIGLIDASRGGSGISAWLSADALKKAGGFDEGLAALKLHAKSPEKAEEAMRLQMEDWWTARAGDTAPAAPGYDDTAWPTTPATQMWENWGNPDLARFDGVMWYRLAIDLTPADVKGAAILALGPIDDIDETFVNGERVGSTRGFDTPRSYRLREGLLQPGRNVIAVRVLDTGGGGGLYGDPAARSITFADATLLPLAGAWRWQKGPSLDTIGHAPTLPWDGVTGLTTLYNGMIAPLEPYAVRGFAWYQGETDIGADATYAKLLPALMADWRDRFGAKPFAIVQLAGYGALASTPTDPAIARLREVQRRTAAADPDAAIATAIDIGDQADVHPTNKLELGRRLAIAARQIGYGEKIDGSGPMPLSAVQDGEIVTVGFDSKGAAMAVAGGAGPIGFELCDAARRCGFAAATADGTNVRIPASGVVASVHYLWAESPIVNLYDAHGLPALPFTMPVTQRTPAAAPVPAAPQEPASGQSPSSPTTPPAGH